MMGGGISHASENELATMKDTPDSKGRHYLRGIVDMGSNGIRFSISNLAPPTSRILPTLVSYRLDISLYEAQYDDATHQRIPIPDKVTKEVVAALLRFQVICNDFDVPNKYIRIIATEATRTAINSAEYCKKIKKATDLEVEMLKKEQEGSIGALGVASGFSDVSGLVMDLGGGSMQITWLVMKNGHVTTSDKGSVSFPYGASALTKKLAALRAGKSEDEGDTKVADFKEEMKTNFKRAYSELEVPDGMVDQAQKDGGFPIYLTGGGFRGWGYLLLYMSQVHGRHYPISIINGFSATHSKFADVERLKKVARQAEEIFRVSDRRREQVPAVAFLVSVLSEALPHGIKIAHFCQGGVREGILFNELEPNVRDDDPLEVATRDWAHESAGEIGDLFRASVPIPSTTGGRAAPILLDRHLIQAFANMLYVHLPMSKEQASTAALYSTSTGIMSAIHGVSHEDRALLALMLEERYKGDLPPRETEFKASLQALLTPEEVWWTRYLGAIGLLISTVYHAGLVKKNKEDRRINITSEWAKGFGKGGEKEGLRLILSIKHVKNDPMMLKETLDEYTKDIIKVGKKKHWIGGREGWGMAIDIKVKEVKDLD